MGLDVGGYEDKPDWPKMGPSLLIAAALILAIRTAKWPVRREDGTSNRDLEAEIEHAVFLAGLVFAALISKKPNIFPSKKQAWYVANDDDAPK